MRKLVSLWLFVHLSILIIHCTLGPDISFQSIIDGIASIMIIIFYLFLIVITNLIVIKKGRYEFNLDHIVKQLFKKLEKARKDYISFSNKLEKIKKEALSTDDWICLSSYGDSMLEIKQTIINKVGSTKEIMFELEDKIQILNKMEYRTFWSYLKSFKWF